MAVIAIRQVNIAAFFFPERESPCVCACVCVCVCVCVRVWSTCNCWCAQYTHTSKVLKIQRPRDAFENPAHVESVTTESAVNSKSTTNRQERIGVTVTCDCQHSGATTRCLALLSVPCFNWPLATLCLTDELSQSAPMNKKRPRREASGLSEYHWLETKHVAVLFSKACLSGRAVNCRLHTDGKVFCQQCVILLSMNTVDKAHAKKWTLGAEQS